MAAHPTIQAHQGGSGRGVGAIPFAKTRAYILRGVYLLVVVALSVKAWPGIVLPLLPPVLFEVVWKSTTLMVNGVRL
jgi:hypothetical protein